MRGVLVVGALAIALAACGGNVVNLGSNDAGDGGGSTGDASPGVDGSTTAVDGATSNPLSGTYKGYVESFTFPDGSDALTLDLAFAADGSVSGTVLFGNGPPLAPPTDPNVGYPPGFTGDRAGAAAPEGFAFMALDVSYSPPRLQLRIDPGEMWKQWCGLQQTIYPVENGASDGGCGALLGYGCLPNAATGGGTAGCQWMGCGQSSWTPIDCGKMALCAFERSPCTCTATSCTVAVGNSGVGSIALDMQLVAGSLDGSVTGIGGSNALNVHLTRQP